MSPFVLVLFASRHGSTRALAEQLAAGIESTGIEAKLRTVRASGISEDALAHTDGTLYVESQDLKECSGLALGSPTRFGQMESALSAFMQNTTTEWLSGELIDKPATVFTSSSSMHGGQESTLLSMMLPLLHHGMLISGIPYSSEKLHSTSSGGTPYGASHVSGEAGSTTLTQDEKTLAFQQGVRLGKLASTLASQRG